jgi:hypothetical protein
MNHKFLELVAQKQWKAIAVWTFALGYTVRTGLAGYVPAKALPLCHGTRREAQILVENNLWTPHADGWEFRDFAEWQAITDEALARKKRASDAALLRWDKEKGRERDHSA